MPLLNIPSRPSVPVGHPAHRRNRHNRLMGPREKLVLAMAAMLWAAPLAGAAGPIGPIFDTQRLTDVAPDELDNWAPCSVVLGRRPRVARNTIPPKITPPQGLDGDSAGAYGNRFLVLAHDAETAKAVCGIAERHYATVLAALGLWRPEKQKGFYPITVYRDVAEYKRKAGVPPRSAGMTMGNAIYLHGEARVKEVLAHEVTHVIFHEHLGGVPAPWARWFDEGLASVMEMEAMPRPLKEWTQGELLTEAEHPMSMSELFLPRSLSDQDFERWYRQAGSRVWFMLRNGGRQRMGRFIRGLRGWPMIAFRYSYAGVWRDMNEMDQAWVSAAPHQSALAY